MNVFWVNPYPIFELTSFGASSYLEAFWHQGKVDRIFLDRAEFELCLNETMVCTLIFTFRMEGQVEFNMKGKI